MMVEKMVEKGVPLDGMQYSMQPLHLASEGGHVDLAEILVDEGAPLDAKGDVSAYQRVHG